MYICICTLIQIDTNMTYVYTYTCIHIYIYVCITPHDALDPAIAPAAAPCTSGFLSESAPAVFLLATVLLGCLEIAEDCVLEKCNYTAI